MGDILFVWATISNMLGERMRATRAQQLVSLVWSVFNQACLNRSATHLNTRKFGNKQCLVMFGCQTFPI